MKRFLIVTLVLGLVLGGLEMLVVPTFSQLPSRDHYSGYFRDIWGNNRQMSKEIRENNVRLLDVWGRKVTPIYNALTAQDVPVAGYFIDVVTNTLYIGFTEIKDDYTKPIRTMVRDEVNLEFFRAKFTYKELRDIQNKIGESMIELHKAGIPITSVGVDVRRNALTVGLEEVKPVYMDAVRNMVESRIPIIFYQSSIKELSRTAWYRPVYGGIKLTSSGRTSTLGFAATLSGIRGFVMSGHVGGEGTWVYQPTSPWPWNYVGIISKNPVTFPQPRYSDSAFVPTTDIKSTIYPNRSIAGWRPSLHTPPGTFVDVEGMVTGYTFGIVVETGRQVYSPTHGPLLNQIYAVLYPIPEEGDSGAPVFWWNSNPNEVWVCGILAMKDFVSGWGWVAIYSPVDGIQRDLGIVP